jgi:hypothetical protein
MDSKADQKAPQRKPLFCSDCEVKLKDDHVCQIYATSEAGQAKQEAE